MLHKWFARKGVIVLLFGVLLAGYLAPVAPAAAAAGEGSAVVVVESLNLRTGPGLDYDVQRLLPRGQELVVLGTDEDGKWSEVRLPNGVEGWVYSVYIQAASAPDANANGEVAIDRLNLRAGPGFNYRVLRVLEEGQALRIQGRSEDSNWLQVALPEGLGGWVYAYFIETEAEVAGLPVKEARGGPDGSGDGARPSYSMLVTIENNQAELSLAGFPADKRFTVALGLPGEQADLVVAKGRTSANGAALVTFEMPAKWSNGKPVKENRLVVTLSAEDGTFTRSINIQYYRW